MPKAKAKRAKRASNESSTMHIISGQHSPVSYTLDLDRLDLGLLPMESLLEKFTSKVDRGAVLLWRPQSRNDVQSFTVHAARDHSPTVSEDDSEPGAPPFDRNRPNPTSTIPQPNVAQPGFTRCHICTTDVPTDFIAQHSQSASHETLLKLAHSALRRLDRHYERPVSLNKETGKETSDTHYCVACNLTMPKTKVRGHERGFNHKDVLERDEQLTELCLVYVANDPEIHDELPVNTALQRVSAKVLGEKESAERATQRDAHCTGDSAMFNDVNDINTASESSSVHSYASRVKGHCQNNGNTTNGVMVTGENHGETANDRASGSSQNDGKTANSVLGNCQQNGQNADNALGNSQQSGETANSVLGNSQQRGKTASGVLGNSQQRGKTANSVLGNSQQSGKTANSVLGNSQQSGKTANSVLGNSQQNVNSKNRVLGNSHQNGKSFNNALGSSPNHTKTAQVVTKQNKNAVRTKNNALQTQQTCKCTETPPSVYYCMDCDKYLPNDQLNITLHRTGKRHRYKVDAKKYFISSNERTRAKTPPVSHKPSARSEGVPNSQNLQSKASNLPKKPALSASPKITEVAVSKPSQSSSVQRNAYVEKSTGDQLSTVEHLNDPDHKKEAMQCTRKKRFNETKYFMEFNKVLVEANCGNELIVDLFHWNGIKALNGPLNDIANYKCLICDEMLPDSRIDEHMISDSHLLHCRGGKDGIRKTRLDRHYHCVVCNETFMDWTLEPRHNSYRHQANWFEAVYAHPTNILGIHAEEKSAEKGGFPFVKLALGSLLVYIAVRRFGCKKGALVCGGAVILGKIFGY